jgi:hypothetical protein
MSLAQYACNPLWQGPHSKGSDIQKNGQVLYGAGFQENRSRTFPMLYA